MPYVRKTRDRWDIEVNYGYGWETECNYYSWKECKRDYAEYLMHIRHYDGQIRVVKRREKINAEEATH